MTNEAHAGLRFAIAIPVCNERDHIARCLAALDTQQGLGDDRFGVVLFLNNCTDDTADIVTSVRRTLSFPLEVVVRDHPQASAGWARRQAMEIASAWLDEVAARTGILLTTDADSRVPSDWLARNRAGLEAGADVVAGRLALDADDAAALPTILRARGVLEAEYETLIAEIYARLDPIQGDPWPNHACHSGASLGTWVSTYRRVGGMPDLVCGEDRAYVETVLAFGGLVRHDPDIVVVTSGRLVGRARGGVADTIRLRCEAPDSPCDDRLEATARVAARANLRRYLRAIYIDAGTPGALAALHAIFGRSTPGPSLTDLLSFDAMFAALEHACPDLDLRPVRPSQLPREIRRAKRLLRLVSGRSC